MLSDMMLKPILSRVLCLAALGNATVAGSKLDVVVREETCVLKLMYDVDDCLSGHRSFRRMIRVRGMDFADNARPALTQGRYSSRLHESDVECQTAP